MFTGASGLNGRIQRQNIGLESNAIDYASDVGDFLRTVGDVAHGFYDAIHHVAASVSRFRCVFRQLGRLTCVIGILFNGGGQLLHAGGGLFQRGGLLFRAGGEIVVTVGDRAGTAENGIGTVAHIVNSAQQCLLHMVEARGNGGHFTVSFNLQTGGEVAFGEALHLLLHLLHRR